MTDVMTLTQEGLEDRIKLIDTKFKPLYDYNPGLMLSRLSGLAQSLGSNVENHEFQEHLRAWSCFSAAYLSSSADLDVVTGMKHEQVMDFHPTDRFVCRHYFRAT